MSTATRFTTRTQTTVSQSYGGPALDTRSQVGVSLVGSNQSTHFSPRFVNSSSYISNKNLSTPINSIHLPQVDDFIENNTSTPLSQESFDSSSMPCLSPRRQEFQNDKSQKLGTMKELPNDPSHDNTNMLINLVQQMMIRDENRQKDFMEYLERERRDRLEERQERWAREDRDRNDRLACEKRESENSLRSENMKNSDSIKCLKMPFFDDNDDIDVFIQKFERIATIQSWPHSEWATRLGTLLKGKAAEAYAQVPIDDACNYDKVKCALYNRFKVSAETCRIKFRSMKKEENETFSQFVNRLKYTLNRWITLSQTDKLKENVLEDLIIQEQLYNMVTPDLDLFLRQNRPSNIDEAATLADTFDDAWTASQNKTKERNSNPFYNHEKNSPTHSHDGKSECQTQIPKLINNVTDAVTDADVKSSKCSNKNSPYEKLHAYSSNPELEYFNSYCQQNGANESYSQSIDYQHHFSINQQNRILSPKDSSSVPTESYDTQFNHAVTVSGFIVVALRDTGSTDSLVDAALVPEDAPQLGSCQVSLADGSVCYFPRVVVKVETPFFTGDIVATAIPGAADSFVIGNKVTYSDMKEVNVPVFPGIQMKVFSAKGSRVQSRKKVKKSKEGSRTGKILSNLTDSSSEKNFHQFLKRKQFLSNKACKAKICTNLSQSKPVYFHTYNSKANFQNKNDYLILDDQSMWKYNPPIRYS